MSKYLEDSSTLTPIGVVSTAVGSTYSYDYIQRLVREEGEDISHVVQEWDSGKFVTSFFGFCRSLWDDEREVLLQVIRYDKRLRDYNNAYIANLLEITTDEEFERQAAELAIVEEADIPEIDLQRKILLLRSSIEWDLSASEIGDILGCSSERVVAVCDALPALEDWRDED